MKQIRKVIRQIAPFMKSQGFQQNKKYFYYIRNDMAFCLEFDAPGGILYTTFYIMPLFIPSTHRYYTFGNRINAIPHGGISPLAKTAQDEDYTAWCNKLIDCLQNRLIPIWNQISTPEDLLHLLETNGEKSTVFAFCPDIFLSRLRMFVYLYCGLYDMVVPSIDAYIIQLRKCTFLTENAKKNYENEANLVRLFWESKSEKDFLHDTIENTRRLF